MLDSPTYRLCAVSPCDYMFCIPSSFVFLVGRVVPGEFNLITFKSNYKYQRKSPKITLKRTQINKKLRAKSVKMTDKRKDVELHVSLYLQKSICDIVLRKPLCDIVFCLYTKHNDIYRHCGT